MPEKEYNALFQVSGMTKIPRGCFSPGDILSDGGWSHGEIIYNSLSRKNKYWLKASKFSNYNNTIINYKKFPGWEDSKGEIVYSAPPS